MKKNNQQNRASLGENEVHSVKKSKSYHQDHPDSENIKINFEQPEAEEPARKKKKITVGKVAKATGKGVLLTGKGVLTGIDTVRKIVFSCLGVVVNI